MKGGVGDHTQSIRSDRPDYSMLTPELLMTCLSAQYTFKTDITQNFTTKITSLDTMEPVKIVTPIGMMGYNYEIGRLFQGIKMGATAIICDSGSTDGGPRKLGQGESTCPREAYVTDLGPILDACYHHKVKAIISSAGGDGTNAHVDSFVEIAQEHCLKQGYNLKLVKIYADVDKEVVREALKNEQIKPCGTAPELQEVEIDTTSRIVAQMGLEPFLQAMTDFPDYDIIISGRAYDPSPYAAYCLHNGITNLGIAYHMGKVMECGGVCTTPKSKEALATIWNDRFEITPLQPTSICTADSLAAHSLYEHAHADIHPGPGGNLDLTHATFTEAEERSCSSSGAIFHPANQYTVKLEGAKVTGYRTIFLGSIRDPILISQIDQFLKRVDDYIASKFEEKDYKFMVKVYGKNGTMGEYEPDSSISKEIFLLGEVEAPSQTRANEIASAARIAVVHAPYPGQKATAGNFAMPVDPLHIPLGGVSSFNIYHLMSIDDPLRLFTRSLVSVGCQPEDVVTRNPAFGYDLIPDDEPVKPPVKPETTKKSVTPLLLQEKVPLTSLARVIRSKNAGPFEITFDVIFNDLESYNYAKKSPAFKAEAIAPLYHLTPDQLIACQFFEPAKAFKFTIPRPGNHGAGGFGERDVHASQQHAPLMALYI